LTLGWLNPAFQWWKILKMARLDYSTRIFLKTYTSLTKS
jgi:hypothetical protein